MQIRHLSNCKNKKMKRRRYRAIFEIHRNAKLCIISIRYWKLSVDSFDVMSLLFRNSKIISNKECIQDQKKMACFQDLGIQFPLI